VKKFNFFSVCHVWNLSLVFGLPAIALTNGVASIATAIKATAITKTFLFILFHLPFSPLKNRTQTHVPLGLDLKAFVEPCYRKQKQKFHLEDHKWCDKEKGLGLAIKYIAHAFCNHRKLLSILSQHLRRSNGLKAQNYQASSMC
jgi:hypothetical protein